MWNESKEKFVFSEFSGEVGAIYLANRRKTAEPVTRDSKKFYRYNIVACINHGLARQDKPLPSGIPIQITFARADAKKGLLQVLPTQNGKKYTYPNRTIPLLNPVLSCYFVESEKASQMYSKAKMYDVNLKFLDYSVRRELLMNGVSDYNLKLFEG